MLKRLAIVAGVALVVAVVLAARYDQNYDAGRESYNVKCEQPSRPSPAAAALTCTIHRENEADQGKAGPPWWNKLVAWPEGITAWLLMFTLGAIVWQAWETRKSANATQVSVEFVKKQVELMAEQNKNAKDRERARLLIRRLDKPEISESLPILEGMRALRARVFVENLGRSRAYNVRAFGIVDIAQRESGGAHERGFQQNFPQIVDEGETLHPLPLGGMGVETKGATMGDFIAIDDETAERLREGEQFVKASGLLSYEDIFGDAHETPFQFVWNSTGDDDGGRWRLSAHWLDVSDRST